MKERLARFSRASFSVIVCSVIFISFVGAIFCSIQVVLLKSEVYSSSDILQFFLIFAISVVIKIVGDAIIRFVKSIYD